MDQNPGGQVWPSDQMDCDETFSYWEPFRYLDHGYGLQAWDYSPEFRIRNWAYIDVHAIPANIAGLCARSKSTEFYALRVLLAFLCAATETRLYSAISCVLDPRIRIIYLMIVAFSPGFFYASSALVSSSFAMYTSTLGLTSFMDCYGGPNTAKGIMWFGIGAQLGWPFGGALIVPFVIEDWLTAVVGQTDAFETSDGFSMASFAVSSSWLSKSVSMPSSSTNRFSCLGRSWHPTCLAGRIVAPTFSVPNPGTIIFEIYF
ncbi:hypothetical protein PV11_03801 [Exophiala sideris]|uniref:Mannosyltransferase n=1 Tax=Exophiala sideris TaxID=1016849 RepID=A0A0D1X286_9EURO|nr:hypothetical protein PV11_03801 [Exophiala sideris]